MSSSVVLLHGLATSPTRTWADTGLVDLLVDTGRTVTAPHMPGHGPGASTDPDDYDDPLGSVFDLLPPGASDVVGFSLGAQFALRIALAHPERVDRLVVAGVGENVFRRDDASVLIEALLAGEAGDNVFAGHFLQLARESGNEPRALAALLSSNRSDPLDPSDLAAIEAPTLVVIGSDDFVGPADRLARSIPGSRLCELRGVDHFQTPKSFSFFEATLAFLDEAP